MSVCPRTVSGTYRWAQERPAREQIGSAPWDALFLRQPHIARLFNRGLVKEQRGSLELTEAGRRLTKQKSARSRRDR